jgi:uncharacterized OsmC-like protein
MVDVDATGPLAARAGLKAEIPDLSLNDLIVKAAAEAFAAYRGVVDGVDVGFAVDTSHGLLVPVLRDADRRSIPEVVAERSRLVADAQQRRLAPADSGDADFTVSNLGMYGIKAGTPVINLGEPLLVFVGAIEDRATVVGGQVVVRPMLTLSIAYDHREADGVAASRFTAGVKERLEGLRAPSPAGAAPPERRRRPPRHVESVSDGGGYTVSLTSDEHRWSIDEPVDHGGRNTGPTPVTALLGALVSCMTISFKAVAARRGVPVDGVSCRATANPGIIKSIDLEIAVRSPAPEADIRALLGPAERACFVSLALHPDIVRTTALNIEPT